MLMELKIYLQTHGSASLSDLSNHFRIAPDALRGMLAHWTGKGMVVRRDGPETCGGCAPVKSCCGCALSANAEVYEWVGRRAANSR